MQPGGNTGPTFLQILIWDVTTEMAEWYRASANGAVDSGVIPSRVKPMTLKLLFAASLLDVQHYRDSVKNKPASLLVLPLGRALWSIDFFIFILLSPESGGGAMRRTNSDSLRNCLCFSGWIFLLRLAAGQISPSRDNHCEACYPRTQQRD